MIIPVAHENLRGRRWPWVTIAIIAMNTVIFVLTISPMETQQRKVAEVQTEILVLSARFPEATPTPIANHMIQLFKRDYPALYKQIGSGDANESSPWNELIKSKGWSEADADGAMNDLCAEFDQALKGSITWNYAFHPYEPKMVSYVTANFLHGGWAHLIFNMWFLWLAGTILEDTWGRIVYPIFYLIAGFFALLVHAAFFPGSMVPVLGASGAIAGLMGAFLARFPTTKIKLMWLWFLGLGRYSFHVPAYVILPLWLAIQVLWGILGGAASGVAYWAHVGGFAFGMLMAVGLKATGIEQRADEAIEAKVSWTADSRIVQAAQLLVDNDPTACLEAVQTYLIENPDSAQALDLQLRAWEKLRNYPEARSTLAELCRVHLFSGERDLAWNCFEQFRNMGGEKLPRAVWFELCRYAEAQGDWTRAANEYERFAKANLGERNSATAFVSAGQICLERLGRTDRAEGLFRMAAESPCPHSDLDAKIEDGLQRCGSRSVANHYRH